MRDDKPMPARWGSVARRGARSLELPTDHGDDRPVRPARAGSDTWEAERWVADPVARAKPANDRTPPRRTGRVPREVVSELGSIVGATQGPRLAERLAEAAKAYDHDRYAEARRLLKPLVGLAPSSPAVRELLGLTLYRLGKWRDAIRELEAFVALSASFDQHPVLADCHRALRHWARVGALWDELREASPSPEVVAEGRIVAAGALADRGDIQGAVALLERSGRSVPRARLHHLRLWYTLADLYERAGDMPRARELFRLIVERDPGFADAAERVAALR